MPLHTDAFTHRHFYTQKLLHTETFYAQKRKGCARRFKIAILLQFSAIEPHFVRKGCAGHLQIAILLQFLAIEPHFVRKGSPDNLKSLFTSVLGDRTSFRAKGLRRTPTSSFCRSNLISCERVAPGSEKSQFYNSFWRSNLISCERVAPGSEKSQFYFNFWRSSVISCERFAFRAVSLALHRAFKREIEKKKRARGQERKRAREQEGKM